MFIKTRIASLLSVVIFIFIAAESAFGQSATYKQDSTGHKFIEVTVPASLQGVPPQLTVDLNRLDDKGKPVPPKITKVVMPSAIVDEEGNDAITFSMPLDSNLIPNINYKIGVSSAGIRWLEVGVDRGLAPDFSTGPGRQCTGGISLVLSGPSGDIDDPVEGAATKQFWEPVFNYVHKINQSKDQGKFVHVRVSNQGQEQVLGVNSIAPDETVVSLKALALAGKLPFCIDPSTKPPSGNFSMAVQFLSNSSSPLPPALVSEFKTSDLLSWSRSPVLVDGTVAPGNPGERTLEHNLDLSVSMTRFKDADTQKYIKRAVLDFRFAPWLNTRTIPKLNEEQHWFRYWTPIYIDANVATGKIKKETLSLNRIVLGTDIEFRYLSLKTRTEKGHEGEVDTRHYTSFQRFILKFNNATDRDFKQAEFTGSFEYQPYFAGVNHPIQSRWEPIVDPISGKGDFKFKQFGYEFIPKFGLSLGRTYARRNPAEAIKPSDTVRRFYGGLDMGFDITSHFKLTINDTFYVRGELPSHRFKNYFKGEIYAPISSPFRQTVHGLFFSFERGNQPPFSNPDVNAIKIGYRIQSDGWFGLRR
jgi:hypothetical protein